MQCCYKAAREMRMWPVELRGSERPHPVQVTGTRDYQSPHESKCIEPERREIRQQ